MNKYMKTMGLALALLFSSAASAVDDTARLNTLVKSALPDFDITLEGAKQLGDTGLYEVLMNGEVVYISTDGRYVFQGDVIELASRENLTDQRRQGISKAAIDGLNEADMIVYAPDKVQHTVTIFTDIDCGYCRKLHVQMDEYLKLGIKVRYLAYPRGGLDSESYDKAVAVWCAADKPQALTDAKNGVAVAKGTCDSPVAAQYNLGGRIGVSGTPAIFFEDGELVPGYIPPAELKAMLERRAAG